MGIREWLHKKFDPNKTAEELAMNIVIKGGYLGERIDVVEEIGGPDSKEVWSGKHNKITLPWLDISHKRDNFEKVDAFQSMLNIQEWLKTKPDGTEDKDPESVEAAGKVNQKTRQCGTLIVGLSMSDPEDMKNVILSKPYLIDMGGGRQPIPYNAKVPFVNQPQQGAND